MNPFLVVAIVCTILAFGHVWWGIVHPLPALKKLNPEPVVTASYHACWYHISVVFLVSAGICLWHVYFARMPVEVLWVAWVMIFGCWLAYWGVLIKWPVLWRIAWGQMALIALVLTSLALGALSG